MMHLRIDNKRVVAQPGQTLLEVARAEGIVIPTLCYHAGVEAWGGCRLCMVEIHHPRWPDESRLVTSCVYPAEDGLVVATASEKVLAVRRLVLDLLLARCPDSQVVRALAEQHGIVETSFVPRHEPDLCILCGLCVRVCAAVGAHAISTSGRGADKQVCPPFRQEPMACIGCLSCAVNCPTGAIPYDQTATSRTIWKRTFELATCPECGQPLGTRQQLKHFAVRSGLPATYFERCDACRKHATAQTFSRLTAVP